MCSTGSHAPQQGSPGASVDGCQSQPRSGTYSGWLSKAKGDGARAKWLASAGWRYFTIDFDNHVLFYSHSESSKQVSVPTPFADILGASMSVESAAGGAVAPTMRRTLSSSLLGAAPTAGGARSATCFALHTVDRRVRLEARSEFEARSWVEQLNSAKLLAQGRSAQKAGPSPCPSEASQASQSTSASGSSCGSAPSGRTTPSDAGGPDAAGRCMAGAASADGMDAFWELERALQEEMDARALCDTAPERRQRGMVAAVGDCAPPKRGLAAADFGLDDEGGLLSGELSGEDEPLPSAPAAEASDDGSDEECDAQARRRRAQSDLLLAAPARAGVAGRRRSHKRDHRARREQQAEEGCAAAAGLGCGDAEAAVRAAADMRLARRGGGACAPQGRTDAADGALGESAARRAERIAAGLSGGDAGSAARIAADLLLVERLRDRGGGGR